MDIVRLNPLQSTLPQITSHLQILQNPHPLLHSYTKWNMIGTTWTISSMIIIQCHWKMTITYLHRLSRPLPSTHLSIKKKYNKRNTNTTFTKLSASPATNIPYDTWFPLVLNFALRSLALPLALRPMALTKFVSLFNILHVYFVVCITMLIINFHAFILYLSFHSYCFVILYFAPCCATLSSPLNY